MAYWGGWAERKRARQAIDALANSLGRQSHHLVLVTVGQPPAYVARSALSVEVHGRVSSQQLVDLVDSCHVSIYPSSDEGYGLPVVESLLRDRPVVVRDLPSYGTFLASESPGVVVLADDSEASMLEAIFAAAAVLPGSARASLAEPDGAGALNRTRAQLMAVPTVAAHL